MTNSCCNRCCSGFRTNCKEACCNCTKRKICKCFMVWFMLAILWMLYAAYIAFVIISYNQYPNYRILLSLGAGLVGGILVLFTMYCVRHLYTSGRPLHVENNGFNETSESLEYDTTF